MVSKAANKNRRALPKEVRKEQLIQATIKCIAKHGLSGVTMARVTQEAGLSLGIVGSIIVLLLWLYLSALILVLGAEYNIVRSRASTAKAKTNPAGSE